jgi:hypothetical protein
VLTFTFARDRIVSIDVIGDPVRLRTLSLSAPHLQSHQRKPE